MPPLFGTDGVRGIANEDLTSELATSLGRAFGTWLRRRGDSPSVVIGRDTRASGTMLEDALSAGFLSAGAGVLTAGVVPTPGVAFLVKDLKASAGAVISASHNPAEYNGIKFFGPDGFKLSDQAEADIESLVESGGETVRSEEVGRVGAVDDVLRRLEQHSLAALEDRSLDGLRVVVDCANGAAYQLGPRVLEAAGAEVIAINDKPNGTNINLGCGSTNPEAAARLVSQEGADAGLALDGDADRVIAIDERGRTINGDAMLAVFALDLKKKGELQSNAVVVTVMSNLGMKRALEDAGIDVVETPVGDRFVIEEMRRRPAALGGEQSGHIVLAPHSTTGDGLITGLRLMSLLVASPKPLSELTSIFEPYPQVLHNVVIPNPMRVESSSIVAEAVQEAERELGREGRVLVRPSGTEPLVRVMVEAQTEQLAENVAVQLVEVVKTELGGDA